MNYVELLAENDKNLAKIEALEAQLKPANIQQFLTFAAIEDMSTKQINEVFTELHENNVSAMAKLKASQEHISQLTAQIEELKAQVVDAVGDGFYDGYLACVKDAREDSFDSFTITDSDVLRLSEQHESEHRYSKSINDIRAKAVMDFAGHARGAYLAGFVPSELTVYDLYQTARNHVKDSYNYETKPWTGEDAEKANGGAT
ncbi:hypothetical protein [Shewanella sp.]|uniref:hypothetical protein n=1 Tax=Shewanella sp. TaxID=50422 RepID=UPI003569DA90